LAEDFAELEMTFDILESTSNVQWVIFKLGAPNPLRQRFPRDRFFHNFCRFRFRAIGCDYGKKNIGVELIQAGTVPSGGDDYTWINKDDSTLTNYAGAKSAGSLLLVSFYCQSAGPIKVKIFRETETQYLFVGEQSINAAAGLNEDVEIEIAGVQVSDFIAFYAATRANGPDFDPNTFGVHMVRHSGDVTTDTLKSAWDTGGGQYLPLMIGGGVDNGQSTCGHRLADCMELGNTKHFGGFPGLSEKGIRLA
jgi:hypothetical protein